MAIISNSPYKSREKVLSEVRFSEESLPRARGSQPGSAGALFDLLQSSLLPSCALGRKNTEHELRYYSPLEPLRQSLRDAARFVVEQYYFPAALVPLVAWFALRGGDPEERKHRVTRARIRRTAGPGGSEAFSLEIKGPKRKNTRLDLSIPISRELFGKLRAWTPYRQVKERFEMERTLGGKRVLIHADVLSEAGNRERLHKPGTIATAKGKEIAFATIEIETEGKDSLELLRRGKYEIDLLDHARPLWKCSKSVRKALSSWRLSRRGADKVLRRAVERLDAAAGKKKLRS